VKLRECVELYIDMKHKNGQPFTLSAGSLRAFANKMGDIHLEAVKVHHVVKFIEIPGTSPTTRQFKYSLLRNFFLHCKGRYPMGEIPMPPRTAPPPPSAFVPRVYSQAEIRMLLRATGPAQADAQCMISARTYRTFLLFLYGTGVSLSEAHRILLQDVNLKRRMMTIRSGSFGRVRTIPFGSDLHRVLAGYIGFRNGQDGPKADRLFIDKRGQPVNCDTLKHTFRRIRKLAGLSSSDIANPPRLRDLRNAFVVHRLSKWSKRGVDLRRMVPALAAYMGLVGLSSTERYLRLTPERFRHQLNLLSPKRGRRRWGNDPGLMRFLANL
jgi:site-specific recombinase XerD